MTKRWSAPKSGGHQTKAQASRRKRRHTRMKGTFTQNTTERVIYHWTTGGEEAFLRIMAAKGYK